MNRKTKKILAVTTVAAMTFASAISMTGCTEFQAKSSAKDEALSQVVKASSYMQEDQAAVKELNKEFRVKINKDKSDKAINKDLKQYKKDVKGFATRKAQIKEFKKLTKEAIKQMDKDQQAKATQILKDNDKRLNGVKTKADFLSVTNEINQKIQEATGTNTGVAAATVESATTAPTKKTQSVAQKTGAKSYSSGLKSTVTARPTSSGSFSRTSSKGSSSSSGSRSMWDDMNSDTPSTPQKQKVWVQDSAAYTTTEYRTVTKYRTVCKTSDGKTFNTMQEAAAYQDWVTDNTDRSCNWWTTTESWTEQVPYTVNHPATGHWEYR